MFAIVTTFTILLSGAHGVAFSHDGFATMASCEKARPGLVRLLKIGLESQHGKVLVKSRCAAIPNSPPPTFEGERFDV